MTVAVLVGAAIAPVVPAAAQKASPAAPDQAGPLHESASSDQIVLRRDDERAVPFEPVVGAGDVPALRRDGLNAVPFVAQVGPQASPADSGSAGSGFDWVAALIGAGSAYGLLLLGAGALMLVRRSRPRVQPRIRPGGTATRVAAQ
jgi:hypothetical protein